jgi:monovalent cation:H+ antiporter-2, CPA2 family
MKMSHDSISICLVFMLLCHNLLASGKLSMEATLIHVLLLLGTAVAVVIIFHKLQIPTSLAYLLVGVLLGPQLIGSMVYIPEFKTLAEFGVVFLLFTIGLNFSLPQLRALKQKVLWLGSGQVLFTTLLVWLIMWLSGLSGVAAFVLGAVFAQSSTTIIAKQLAAQEEENSHHGRYGLAMSVFQDVTAVPFLIIIPALGLAVSMELLAISLTWAMVKAILALIIVFILGRWLLHPLFYLIAARPSAEVFTLTVLLVALSAAWISYNLGLSLAFGAFIAGMVLGETEFRHQVESSIRPFRDVLLGLFFIGIGMLFDPIAILAIWHWAILGALLILGSKICIVWLMLYATGVDSIMALRTGLLLAVGGEFGFALIMIALDAKIIDSHLGQISMTAVLISMFLGAFLIRYNEYLATKILGSDKYHLPNLPNPPQVLICGYGRVGHTIAVLLQSSKVAFVAYDTDHNRVLQGKISGHNVLYGDVADAELLTAIRVEQMDLVIISVDKSDTALKIVNYLRRNCPQVPVIARARDLAASSQLLDAGATQAQPEIIEASLRLGAAALQVLQVKTDDIDLILQDVRDWQYQPVVENKN